MAELREKVVESTTTDVLVVTTNETVVISSGAVKVPSQTCVVHVRGWCQFALGAGVTGVTPRIRRGATTGGALVGEGNPEAVKTAAGSTEPFMIEATERRSNEESVEYSLTVVQTGATGNGTVVQAAIEVEVLGG